MRLANIALVVSIAALLFAIYGVIMPLFKPNCPSGAKAEHDAKGWYCVVSVVKP